MHLGRGRTSSASIIIVLDVMPFELWMVSGLSDCLTNVN